ncbi:hypothetical protein CAPTEDRAFT_211518 [Capitella teleta]|uniref:Uncharacterized protein n=1 Tax=Capitella teleta TaxID=283909 RepID=R7UBW8_CAPTE|nr:hypothetical protein CAPTEDRAFT_211518 [Capitella teleta]|eukprot:ELU03459.1 hypothetical protein CAPTEDRAFT_211518 [Capitella teleta]
MSSTGQTILRVERRPNNCRWRVIQRREAGGASETEEKNNVEDTRIASGNSPNKNKGTRSIVLAQDVITNRRNGGQMFNQCSTGTQARKITNDSSHHSGCSLDQSCLGSLCAERRAVLGTKNLRALRVGERVNVWSDKKECWVSAKVVQIAINILGHNYVVETIQGLRLRRNKHLIRTKLTSESDQDEQFQDAYEPENVLNQAQGSSDEPRHSESIRRVPQKLDDFVLT